PVRALLRAGRGICRERRAQADDPAGRTPVPPRHAGEGPPPRVGAAADRPRYVRLRAFDVGRVPVRRPRHLDLDPDRGSRGDRDHSRVRDDPQQLPIQRARPAPAVTTESRTVPGEVHGAVRGLRVLAFCDYFATDSSGGSERVAAEVYERLTSAGADIVLLT